MVGALYTCDGVFDLFCNLRFKLGGCGAKFLKGDPAIEGQQLGQVPNPDIADVQNTVLKMADKDTIIIPGHGPLSTVADARKFVDIAFTRKF